MKKLLIICIFASGCITQKFSSTGYPSPFQYTRVDSIQGTKNELFVKADEWVARTFVSAKDVIQMKDKDAGKIIAKGIFQKYVSLGTFIGAADYYISYTMAIDVKDNKYRISITNEYVTQQTIHPSGGIPYTNSLSASLDNDEHPATIYNKAWINIRGYCDIQSKGLIANFALYMNAQKTDNF